MSKERLTIKGLVQDLRMIDEGHSAVEGLAGDWFGGLRAMFHEQGDLVFRELEKVYKAEYQVKRMPTTYRSAKSVLLAAKKYSIAIEGQGKTALEKQVSAKKREEAQSPQVQLEKWHTDVADLKRRVPGMAKQVDRAEFEGMMGAVEDLLRGVKRYEP